MTELTEAETAKLNDGRALRESASLIPLLDTKERMCIGRIVADFKAGKTDFLSHAAELATVAEMKSTITRKINEANYLEQKMLGERP